MFTPSSSDSPSQSWGRINWVHSHVTGRIFGKSSAVWVSSFHTKLLHAIAWYIEHVLITLLALLSSTSWSAWHKRRSWMCRLDTSHFISDFEICQDSRIWINSRSNLGTPVIGLLMLNWLNINPKISGLFWGFHFDPSPCQMCSYQWNQAHLTNMFWKRIWTSNWNQAYLWLSMF